MAWNACNSQQSNKKEQMITIKDVATYAGVSVTTTSYVLNGKGTISDATRKRVLNAAEDLNYHPNAFARNLKKQKTLTIGVFISRFGGSFYEDILEGIHSAILKTDYELIVCPETHTIHKILTQRQVDGAIIFDSKINSATILKLASNTFPIVCLDRNLIADCLLSLLVDNQQGAMDVADHLFQQGARKIAYLSGAIDSQDNTERMRAFINQAAKHNLKVTCYQGNFTEVSGYAVADDLMKLNELPEAIFCANDQMAIGLINALAKNGKKVPDDILVVGFDDIPISRFMKPTLTTVSTSRNAWGAEAATQLIGFLANGTPFRSSRMPIQLIQRESSSRNHKIFKGEK